MAFFRENSFNKSDIPRLLDPTSSQREATWLLGLETSGKSATVALTSTFVTVGNIDTSLSKEQSQLAGGSLKNLALQIRRVLSENHIRPADLSAIAVTIGPGSFTGLRVGVTTANTMAYALGIPVIGVDTLELIATQVAADSVLAPPYNLWTIMDAYRGELFAAKWRVEPNRRLVCVHPSYLIQIEKFFLALSEASDLQIPTMVGGPGVARCEGQLPRQSLQIPDQVSQPAAEFVCKIGRERWEVNAVSSPFQILPRYLRRSAAEEKATPRVAES